MVILRSVVLKAENVCYEYPGNVAVSKVDFSLVEGERLVILGPNGAGKTTLLKLLAGLLEPSSGQVLISGVNAISGFRKLAGKVGFLFQDPDDQIFMPTVERDVAFGPTNLNRPVDQVRSDTEAAMEAVGIRALRKRAPHNLSYGEKKRVALAGILAMSPDILLLDEPTANLDPETRSGLLQLLEETGKTMVVATHDVDAAAKLADRILVIDRLMLGEGSPDEIFSNDNLLAAARLRPPAIFSLFSGLKKRGMYPGKIPLTGEDAENALELLAGKMK